MSQFALIAASPTLPELVAGAGEPVCEIAYRYNVSHSTISRLAA